jgi:hypothetical protein
VWSAISSVDRYRSPPLIGISLCGMLMLQAPTSARSRRVLELFGRVRYSGASLN